jgi:GNAT superfamily N-acetyltransferase
MPVSIRDARPADAEAISRLTAHLGYDVPASDVADRLSRILPRSDHQFFIAEDAGLPIGWLHMAVVEYIETGAFAVINGLVVDRDVRGVGVGTLLLERAEQWAIERNLPFVRLWSTTSRDRAHRFYERNGYVKIKTQYAFIKSVAPDGPQQFGGLVPRIDR